MVLRGVASVDRALAGHLGSERDTCTHVVALEPREVLEHPVDIEPVREEVEDEGDPDPMSTHTRFAETDVRVDAESLEQAFPIHAFDSFLQPSPTATECEGKGESVAPSSRCWPVSQTSYSLVVRVLPITY